MGIRGKLLVLLLLLAVAPLAGVGWFVHATQKELSAEVGRRGTQALTDQVTGRIRQMVVSAAELMNREKLFMEMALRLQVREVERLLAEPPPPLERPVYRPRDFERGGAAPPDIRLSEKHRIHAPGGLSAPLAISLRHPVILRAPGADAAAVRGDVARLSALSDLYRDLYRNQSDLFYWIYTALESGVHASYPGHGEYPDDYDPRMRPWYVLASDIGAMVWNPPVEDATTGQIVATVSAPVRGPNGAVAGVAGMDVAVFPVLDAISSGPGMPAGARAFLVAWEIDGTGRKSLRVIARQFADGRKWRAGRETLAGDDPDRNARMVERMMMKQPGLWRMDHASVDSIWSHGPMDEFGSQLLVIVPTGEIAATVNSVQAYVRGESDRQLAAVGVILGATILVVAGAAIMASREVTEPVRAVAAAARDLAEGDLDARADIARNDETGDLARAFNAMVPQLADRMRVRQALGLAQDVQQHLLPETPPDHPDWDIAGRSVYCDETGGDYYDFIPLPGGGLAVAVGDVTGHGVASALLMTTARASLRGAAERPEPLAKRIGAVNRQLASDVAGGRFMTLFCLEIDGEALRWASAGHDPALVRRPGGGFEELAGEDIPLGVDGNWIFHENSGSAPPPGSVLVIGTDGVWETRDPDGAEFGKDALKAVIDANADASADEIRQAVERALDDFRAHAPRRDDVTFVVMKARKGGGAG